MPIVGYRTSLVSICAVLVALGSTGAALSQPSPAAINAWGACVMQNAEALHPDTRASDAVFAALEACLPQEEAFMAALPEMPPAVPNARGQQAPAFTRSDMVEMMRFELGKAAMMRLLHPELELPPAFLPTP